MSETTGRRRAPVRKRNKQIPIGFPRSEHGIVVFACISALNRLPDTSTENTVEVNRLMCIGRVNAGMILEAVEKGAQKVLVLGCDESSCRHQNGAQLAFEQVQLARNLFHTLGLESNLVTLELVSRNGTSVSVPVQEAGVQKEPS